MQTEDMDLSFILNHLGEEHENYFRAVSPPVIQTSNFTYPTVKDMREALLDEFGKPVYSRGNNPTLEILRKKVAALEGTEDALVTASGCAAITCAVVANLKAGDHVICVEKPYTWTEHLFRVILSRFGVTTTFVDGREPGNIFLAARRNTALIYLESPNTWTFEMQDLRAVASWARERRIVTVADNSYCTPLFQQPAALGIDLVVHSATKYLCGHSDVVAGVICGSGQMIRKIFASEMLTFGNMISPFDAWLMLRGLRTLPLRLEKSSSNAKKLITFLEDHPKVEKIFYPSHPSHPQFGLTQKQMKDSSGLFTVSLKLLDPGEMEAFCNRLSRFLIAVSWGGHESLVFPAIAGYDPSSVQNPRIPYNYVRLYAGLEDPDLLIRDLEQALEKVGT